MRGTEGGFNLRSERTFPLGSSPSTHVCALPRACGLAAPRPTSGSFVLGGQQLRATLESAGFAPTGDV